MLAVQQVQGRRIKACFGAWAYASRLNLLETEYLVAAITEPAAGREVEGALGAGGHVGEAEVAVAVHPGAAHNHVVRRAVGRHQAEHLARLAQLYSRPPCAAAHRHVWSHQKASQVSPSRHCSNKRGIQAEG